LVACRTSDRERDQAYFYIPGATSYQLHEFIGCQSMRLAQVEGQRCLTVGTVTTVWLCITPMGAGPKEEIRAAHLHTPWHIGLL